MESTLIAVGIVFAVAAGVIVLGYRARRQRRVRATAVALIRQLAAALPLTDPQIKKYPTPSLCGRYYTYPFVGECAPQGNAVLWRVHSELPVPLTGRIAIQGEGRHGKMRELYGMEVVLTGDEAFDARFVLSATDEALAHRLFTPYLRSRFLHLPLAVFTFDCQREALYAECTTGTEDAARLLLPVVQLLFEMCDRMTG